MNSRIGIAAIALTAILALSGCVFVHPGAGTPHAKPTPTHSQPPADGGSYGSIDDLRDAYESAGGACAGWNENDIIALAAQSGYCSDSVVLSTYASSSTRDQVVANLKSLAIAGSTTTLLLGENWIINDPDASDLRGKMGGTLVTITGD